MTLRLTVERERWRTHVDSFAGSVDGLVPVAKGNGYGFGLAALVAEAATLAEVVAVGTAHEAATATAVGAVRMLVLTPATPASVVALPPNCVATVGSLDHVRVLDDAGWSGEVSVKLASSMQRYGAAPADVGAVVDAARTAGLGVESFSLHLPLIDGTYGEHDALGEIEAWLAITRVPLSVSHLTPRTFAALRARHAGRDVRLRAGTALWHGDKSFLHLAADVVDVRPIAGGTPAGYRRTEVPGDGSLVMVGAGSTHGIAPLVDGRSPFHHSRRRLALLEPPHMHTSMLFVPAGEPCPGLHEWIDVQRPLTTSTVDDIVWSP